MQQALSAGGGRPSTALAAASSTGGLGCFKCLNSKRDGEHMFVYRRIPGTHVDGWLLHSLCVPYMCLSIVAHHLE